MIPYNLNLQSDISKSFYSIRCLITMGIKLPSIWGYVTVMVIDGKDWNINSGMEHTSMNL